MIVVQIRCSRCGAVGAETTDYNRGVHNQRRDLRKKNWYCLEAKGVDLCPNCIPESPQKEMFR